MKNPQTVQPLDEIADLKNTVLFEFSILSRITSIDLPHEEVAKLIQKTSMLLNSLESEANNATVGCTVTLASSYLDNIKQNVNSLLK